MKFDLHFHTMASDGAARIKDILRKIENSPYGVAITDHNVIGSAVKLGNHPKVIPGIEVKITNSVDFVFYFYSVKELQKFYEAEVKDNKKGFWILAEVKITPFELLDISKKYDCFVTMAHPSKYFDVMESCKDKLVAVEVLNSGAPKKGNIETMDWAKQNGLTMTAGSDGHSIWELGRCLTCNTGKNKKEFLDMLKKGLSRIEGTELRFGKKQRIVYNALNRITNLIP